MATMEEEEESSCVQIIQSLCMACGSEQGETRLLLTSLPFFHDVIIVSFHCSHCHFHSAEVEPTAEIKERAQRWKLTVKADHIEETRCDLNRQVVRSEMARVLITHSEKDKKKEKERKKEEDNEDEDEDEDIEFEAPASYRRGEINTIEGYLRHFYESLRETQETRSHATRLKLTRVIEALQAMSEGKRSFTFTVDDLSGNSCIENPYAPLPDPRVTVDHYSRTREEHEQLGYAVEQTREYVEADRARFLTRQHARRLLEQKGTKNITNTSDIHDDNNNNNQNESATADTIQAQDRSYAVAQQMNDRIDTFFNVSDRSACLPEICHNCQQNSETRMAIVDIPHFKDVILMTTECEHCGFRDTEVKPAGKISDHAVRVTLRVNTSDDLKRDLLKSDTSSISIPEIELDMMPGTLGGKYTTIEGILNDVKNQLQEANPFSIGDSSRSSGKSMFGQFLEKLDRCIMFEMPFTFILDDPLGNSFIFSELGANDPQMTIERYVRTHEQNEDMGLNDVVVEPEEYLNEDDLKLFDKEMQNDHQLVNGPDVNSSLGEDGIKQRARVQEDGLVGTKIGGHIPLQKDY